MMAFSPLLRTILAFLVALTDDKDIRKKPIFHPSKGGNALVNVFQDTGIVGIPTLLSGLLLAVSPASRARTRARLADTLSDSIGYSKSPGSPHQTETEMECPDKLWRLPLSAVSTAILALKVLNNAARLDLRTFQEQLSCSGSDLETYHIIDHLLGHVASCIHHVPESLNEPNAHTPPPLRAISWDATHELLAELMLFLGYLCSGNLKMKELMTWGHSPTPLQRICRMPFRFYIHPTDRDIVIPTILCCIENYSVNQRIVQGEISESFFSQYLKSRRSRKDNTHSILPTKSPSYFDLHNRLSANQLQKLMQQLSVNKT